MSLAAIVHHQRTAAAAGSSRPPINFGVLGAPVAINRGYESGMLSIRDPDLPTSPLGPNAAAERGRLDVVVARCRYVARNNELVAAAMDKRVARVIGKNIGWEPNTGIRTLDAKLRRRRDYWVDAADPERKRSLTEICQTAFRERLTAGEFGRHITIAEEFRGRAAGPAVELWTFERMPLTLNGRTSKGGNEVRQGAEYDADNRVVAYWVLVEHPNDDGSFGGFYSSRTYGLAGELSEANKGIRRIPVESAELCFREEEHGMRRGAPPMASVIRSVRSEDGWHDTVMLLQQLLAKLGVFISSKNTQVFAKSMQGQHSTTPIVDVYGNPITRIDGLTVGVVPEGTEIKTANLQGVPGSQFNDIKRSYHQRQSRRFNLPTATYSGDNAGDSFSSRRGDEIDCRDVDETEQLAMYRWIVDPYRRSTIDHDILSGELKLDDDERALLKRDGWELLYKADPSFDGFHYVNPAQESAADAMQWQSGFKSRIKIIQEHGGNWRSVIDQELAFEQYEIERRRELGLPDKPKPPTSMTGTPAQKPGKQQDDEEETDDEGGEKDKKKQGGDRSALSGSVRSSGGRTDAAGRAPSSGAVDGLLGLCIELGREGERT